jgi:hypothetical protein
VLSIRATTSPIADRKAGLRTVSESLCMRTLSLAGSSKPSSRIRDMRPDSPGESLSPSCFVPIAPPITTAAITNAIQPKVAVFQWSALQRAALDARLSLMCLRLSDLLTTPSRLPSQRYRANGGHRCPHWCYPVCGVVRLTRTRTALAIPAGTALRSAR